MQRIMSSSPEFGAGRDETEEPTRVLYVYNEQVKHQNTTPYPRVDEALRCTPKKAGRERGAESQKDMNEIQGSPTKQRQCLVLDCMVNIEIWQ